MKRKLEKLGDDVFQKFENHRIQNLQQVLGGRHWVSNESYKISNGQRDGCDVAKWTFPDDSTVHSLDGVYRCANEAVLPPPPTWDDLPYEEATPEIGDEMVTDPESGEVMPV